MSAASKRSAGLVTASTEPGVVEHFKALYNGMDRQGVLGIDQVYSVDVQFIDPFTRISGRQALSTYLEDAYRNVIRCRFDFGSVVSQGDASALPWTMHLCHHRLKKGQPIQVDGVSCLKTHEGLICYHRDYFDAGQLLYQNLPLIGTVIHWLRRQAS